MKKRVICYLSLYALVLMSAFVLFGSFVMAMIGKVEEKITYVKPDPIYEEVEEIVEKDVYHQNAPTFPVKTTGKELILLDKSGSMKDFVTSLYTANIAFFSKHDSVFFRKKFIWVFKSL